jgi:hypothetical protein
MGGPDSALARAALRADLDLDGRVDNLVVEDRGIKGRRSIATYRNPIETESDSIGTPLRGKGAGSSPGGASVIARTANRAPFGRVATGETIMGAAADGAAFRLDWAGLVESIEVQWVGGVKRIIENPLFDRSPRSVGQVGQHPEIRGVWREGFARVTSGSQTAPFDGSNPGLRLGVEHVKCLSSRGPISCQNEAICPTRK